MPPSLQSPCGPVVEIAVVGKKLRDMDLLSKSDPFVVLFVCGHGFEVNASPVESRRSPFDTPQCRWQYYGETEVVWDNLNPQFTRRFLLQDPTAFAADNAALKTRHSAPENPEYRDHQSQPMSSRSCISALSSTEDIQLRFEVYDADDTNMEKPLGSHDFIGAVSTSLQSLIQRGTITETVFDKKRRVRPQHGFLSLSTERYVLPAVERPLSLSVGSASGCELPTKDPIFFRLVRETLRSRTNEQPHFIPVYRSGAMNPGENAFVDGCNFQNAVLTMLAVTAGDENRPLALELYIHKANGSHVLLGRSEPFTLLMLKRGTSGGIFDMFPPATDDLPSIASGKVCITAQIIPKSVEESGSKGLRGALGVAAHGIGMEALSLDTHHTVTCRILQLGSESGSGHAVGVMTPTKTNSLRSKLRRPSGRI